MSNIRLTRINKFKSEVLINPIVDPHNIGGVNLFETLYANIALISKKKSGKTNLIYNILQNCAGKKTRVFIFSSTVNIDPTYNHILNMLRRKKIQFIARPHFIENGVNYIEQIISEFGGSEDNNTNLEYDPKVKKPKKEKKTELCLFPEQSSRGAEPNIVVRKPNTGGAGAGRKKEKVLFPEIIVVFDDLGEALRHPSISQWCKIHRHLKSKTIISTQSLTDIHPQCFVQFDYVIVFPKFLEEKLIRIHQLLDLGIDIGKFLELYRLATCRPFHFLYIDVRRENYRMNFDTKFEIEE